MNSIDAKGNEFLQLNKPGNDGYGQQGLKGDTGKHGNSVYFSAYRNISDITDLISNNKELSDNPNYPQQETQYKSNDCVIDSAGNVTMIKIKSGNLSFIQMENLLSSGSFINYMQCHVKISNNPDSRYYYKIDNENYIGSYNDNSASPYIYHRDRYNKNICGFWLNFNIALDIESDYLFKYVIVLPNGIKIENIANTTTYEMFFDNRFLYGCFFGNEDNESLKNTGNYHTIENNSEYSYEFTEELASKMTNCTAYTEIIDKVSGKIYRVYSDIDIEIES